MKTLLTAIGLLTRIPVPVNADIETAGRAMRWFPLVGALVGAVYVLVSRVLTPRLPSLVTAVFIVIAEALLTGALHMDGLADTADGFGGGRTREDVLRIMHDHAIGAYGGIALVLMVALKVTTISALLDRQRALPYLWLAPVLGRWSVVPLSRFLPYARPTKAVSSFVKTFEVLFATLLTILLVSAAGARYGLICWLSVSIAAALFGSLCRRKIGGITGDTLGATVEISECIVLVMGLIL